MNPPRPPQAAPKRQPPTPATLRQRAAQSTPAAPPQAPAKPLTPAQQAAEQAKIVAINDAWKAKLSDEEQAEVLHVAGRNEKDLVVDGIIQPCRKRTKPAVLNCLPGDTKLNTGLSKELADAVTRAQEEKRKANNTKIRIDYVGFPVK